MKLLITGAFNCTEEQKLNIKSWGYEIMFHQMENEPLSDEMFDAEVIICNSLFLYNDVDRFPNLKVVQLTSAGLDRVPVEYMNEKGVTLYSARGVYSVPMAEWAITGVFALYKHLNEFHRNQSKHEWMKNRGIKELFESTVCIVGCGNVGTECAKRFKAFNTHIIGVDVVNPHNDVFDRYFSIEKIEEAVANADVVILTLPLTEKTIGMFNKNLFANFKKNAVLVNIARGQIINERDLISALENGQLGGAVLDVFEKEPLSKDNPLWDMQNVIITPHNSFVGDGNKDRLYLVIENNLKNIRGNL